jgi:hypothetical protein
MVTEISSSYASDEHWWVAKTALLKAAFDDMYSDPETRQDRYQEALDALDSDTALDQLSLLGLGDGVLSDADRQSDITKGWQNGRYDGIAPYLRDAIRQAVSHAMERDVELDGVFFGSAEGSVEVAYFDNPSSVVVVIKVPRPWIFSKCPRDPDDSKAHVPDGWTHTLDNGS